MYLEIFKSQYSVIYNDYIKNNLSRGYIFNGPKMLGKFDFACEFVSNILKVDNIFNQQNIVTIDQLYQKGVNTFDDVSKTTNIDQSHRKDKKTDEITVEDIMLVLEKLVFANENNHIWVIINNFDKANIYAVDMLLKVVEENINVTFIFCTSNLQKIKKTIISRCKIINFNKKNLHEVLNVLKLDKSIIDLSIGLPKLALMINNDKILYNDLNNIKLSIRQFIKDKDFIKFYNNISNINTDYIFIFVEYLLQEFSSNYAFFDFNSKLVKILKDIQDNKIDKKSALEFIIFNLFYAIR